MHVLKFVMLPCSWSLSTLRAHQVLILYRRPRFLLALDEITTLWHTAPCPMHPIGWALEASYYDVKHSDCNSRDLVCHIACVFLYDLRGGSPQGLFCFMMDRRATSTATLAFSITRPEMMVVRYPGYWFVARNMTTQGSSNERRAVTCSWG